MKLVAQDDPVLKTVCEEFDFQKPPFDPIPFAHELVRFMYEAGGIGLAANQIGVPYRIFAMRGYPDNFVCFNPKVVDTSTEQLYLDEGCLTYPGLICKVKRPKLIRVRFAMPNGEIQTRQFADLTARVYQHELDHLNGIVFYNKANLFHREQAMRRWKNFKPPKKIEKRETM